MTMGIGAENTVGQLTATGPTTEKPQTSKAQAGFDRLAKPHASSEEREQQRLALAEQTGKGMNIDIMA